METLKFRTNINSAEKLKTAALLLHQISEIKEWSIDLDSIYHLLTIKGLRVNYFEVVKALNMAGYELEQFYEE